MSSSARDRISVDLRGMRAALFEQARANGVRPSDFVRSTLAGALTGQQGSAAVPEPAARVRRGDRLRLGLRMPEATVHETVLAARRAGSTLGDYVADALAGVVPMPRAEHARLSAELAASTAELATLARHLRALTQLLREGSSDAARRYRDLLDTLGDDVRRHLKASGAVLVQLRSRRARAQPEEAV